MVFEQVVYNLLGHWALVLSEVEVLGIEKLFLSP